MVNFEGFWPGKKVFLTGHTGFKGSWLALWLCLRGADVTGYALPAEYKGLYNLNNLDKDVKSRIGDIRDFVSLQKAFDDCNPDIVFHLAAQALVRPSYNDPLETISTNIMGTANLLEIVRRSSAAKVVVNVTSDKCYDNTGLKEEFSENDPMGGYDPYSCSKGCAELVSNSFRQSFYENQGKFLATARAGNVIGGGDWAQDRLIPDIFRAFNESKRVMIRNPSAVRPWQHVFEPLFGYLTLAKKLWDDGQKYAQAWNFGPEQADVQPVSWVVDYICHKWNNGGGWGKDAGEHPHEAAYLALDINKAKKKLGWHPCLGLQGGLDMCVAWYKAFYEGHNIREVSEKQILHYQGKCLK